MGRGCAFPHAEMISISSDKAECQVLNPTANQGKGIRSGNVRLWSGHAKTHLR